MSGIANSLIALMMMRPGTGEELRAALDALNGAPSPFARVTGTHFARWAHVEALLGPDGPLPDGPEYLLLCADFDPPLATWAATMCEQAGAEVDSVMNACAGWPGSDSPRAVADYLARHHSKAGFTVSTYGRATVRQVREALDLRRSLRALAVSAQAGDADGEELRRQWRRMAGR